MNVKRGFFRLWTVGTIVWTAGTVAMAWNQPREIATTFRADGHTFQVRIPPTTDPTVIRTDIIDILKQRGSTETEERQSQIAADAVSNATPAPFFETYRYFILAGIGLPIAALVAGVLIGWIFTGFRSDPRKQAT